jgi:hypothetical protein
MRIAGSLIAAQMPRCGGHKRMRPGSALSSGKMMLRSAHSPSAILGGGIRCAKASPRIVASVAVMVRT